MIGTVARRPGLLLVAIAFVGFISLGLPDGLIGVAWPSIYSTFGIPLGSLGVLLFATTAGYIFASFNSGRFINRFGAGQMLTFACGAMGSGLVGYSLVPLWPLFVLTGFFVGLGAGIIDAGLNTYVAANFRPSLMYWLHACFGLGATIGPFIMNSAIRTGAWRIGELANPVWRLGTFTNTSWRLGYLIVGFGLYALGAIFFVTMNRWTTPKSETQTNTPQDMLAHRTPVGASLRLPSVRLSILLFFCYAGVELSAAHWAFTVLTKSRAIPDGTASAIVSVYWGLFTVGRLLAGFAASKIKPTAQVRIGMGAAVLGAFLFWWNPAQLIGIAGLVLVGFACAPIFPALITNTAERVGMEHATNTIGFQIAGTGFGIMVLPGLSGVLADKISLEVIGLCVLAAAVAILVLHEMIMGMRMAEIARPAVQAEIVQESR
jgi:fucose permease